MRVDCISQVDSEEAADLIDLTTTPEAGGSKHRWRGRFWVLADSDDEEEQQEDLGGMEEEKGAAIEETISVQTACPTTSSRTGESHDPDLHRKRELHKKSHMHMKPWIGRIPKVNRAAITLSDFIPESWTLVTKKKKGKKGRSARPPPLQPPPVARAANEIQAA